MLTLAPTPGPRPPVRWRCLDMLTLALTPRSGRDPMADPSRFTDAKHTLEEFLDEILVVCPRCSKRAMVRPVPDGDVTIFSERRLLCPHCGLARTKKPRSVRLGSRGTPRDAYFGEVLWLQATWGRRIVWAFNLRHLDYLEAFVRAELRSHGRPSPGCSNCSLISRLPRWMKDGSNRLHVLSLMKELRASV